MTLSLTKPAAEGSEGIRIISRYELIAQDIAAATKESKAVKFNYLTPFGNKEARSYVHKLRRLRSSIDAARKAEKADALEYGRRVDAQAKDMVFQVTALIEPHQRILDEIEKIEEDRKARHQAVLDNITDTRTLPEAGESWTSSLIQSRLDFLQPLLADLQSPEPDSNYEEFTPSIFAEIQISLDFLAPLLEKALEEEEDAAELERLREAEAARLEQERIELLAKKRAAKILEEEKEAAFAEIEAEKAKARKESIELQRKEREAAQERKRQEVRERSLLAAEQLKAKKLLKDLEEQLKASSTSTKKTPAAVGSDRLRHINTLVHAMAGMNRLAIATHLVDNTLHDCLHFQP